MSADRNSGNGGRLGGLASRSRLLAFACGAGLISVLAACQYYGQPKSVASAAEAIPDKVDYNWDVRPILSQNCFQCHGNDPKNRKAGLRLDHAEDAYGKLPEDPGKRAIVPGNPKRSELFKRITSTDNDYRMPPREAHKTVSARDIAVLERWIKQGAKYKDHWAYLPVKEVKPGRTEWDNKVVNPIDRYVFAKLKVNGLSPSAQADRESLINRVTLDLTGLPPTLAEVDAFVADKRPNAYEILVDRLLNSTAYAERQANIWLDVARYADSDGFLNDQMGRFQHPYRDWVISAFRRNMPYDRFVTWQLAGDKLASPTREQVLATAFARAGKRSNEGGITDEEYRVEYVNERAELVGKAFLGLTVGCAKCHDHKYDVISQADYYSMAGFFNSVDERGIASSGGGTPMGAVQDWPTAKQAANLSAAKADVVSKQQALEAARAAARRDLQGRIAGQDASGVGTALKASLDHWQQAYYPLDTSYRAPFDSLTINKQQNPQLFRIGLPPPKPKSIHERPQKVVIRKPATDRMRIARDDLNYSMDVARAAGTQDRSEFELVVNRLLLGLVDAQLAWSPSGVKGQAPGGVNNAHVIDGPPGKGKAVLINDTIGFADYRVGQFERSDPFSLDVWVKLRTGKPYDSVNILYNSDKGGAGYELNVVDNHLEFDLQHITPHNMISVSSLDVLPTGQWLHVTATYDGSSQAAGAKLYVDGKSIKTEVLMDHLTRTMLPRGGGNIFGSYFGLAFGRRFGMSEMNKGAVDEVRVFTRTLNPVEVAYLHNPGAAAAPDAKPGLIAALAEQDPRVIAAAKALREARDHQMAVDTPILQLMVMQDMPKSRKNYILDRGQFDQYGKQVEAQALPRVFRWDAKFPRNRLGLTQWLFDPKNPLTARVYVNRMWQGHFGSGIVETVEDFGTQGANPTHPELLDYLAAEFIRSGWDQRHMHKLMVMSATYRQSSAITPDGLEKDPRNFLLARGPRYRLPAETIRDNALLAAGLLKTDQVGGDSVFPYQPEGVWYATGTGLLAYPTPQEVPQDQMHRRSMYTFVKRNAQFPSMAVFDLADRNVSTVARRISSTPLQALVLLNDPQYLEAYRKLAERSLKASGSDEEGIVSLFRLATRRRPLPVELERLKRYRADQAAYFAKAPGKAAELLKVGVAAADPALDPAQLAAMSMVAAAVLNSPDAYTLR